MFSLLVSLSSLNHTTIKQFFLLNCIHNNNMKVVSASKKCGFSTFVAILLP